MYKKIWLSGLNGILRFDKTRVFDNVIEVNKEKGYYVVRRTVKNVTDDAVNLKELKAELTGIDFGGEPKDDYFYCNENARLFWTLTVPVDYDRLNDDSEDNKRFNLPVSRKYCDPEVIEGHICSSPYQPFPAILISNYNSKKGR